MFHLPRMTALALAGLAGAVDKRWLLGVAYTAEEFEKLVDAVFPIEDETPGGAASEQHIPFVATPRSDASQETSPK